MNAAAYSFQCALCDDVFQAPQLSDFSYGLFILRSLHCDISFGLDAATDEVFDQLRNTISSHRISSGLAVRDKAKLVQHIFSITCDEPVLGDVLVIGLQPKCPTCGTREMKSWTPVMPPVILNLPDVTHSKWKNKSSVERRMLIDNAIKGALT